MQLIPVEKDQVGIGTLLLAALGACAQKVEHMDSLEGEQPDVGLGGTKRRAQIPGQPAGLRKQRLLGTAQSRRYQ